MSVRFAFNLATLVAAAFVVVVSMAFAPGVAGWIAFGVSTGITAVGVVGLALAKKLRDRVGQAGIVTGGIWSLVAALVFVGNALTWLVLADATALAAVAVAQLVDNEVANRRALGVMGTSGCGPSSQSADRVGLVA